jgi:O-antigen ligase
VAVAGAIAFVLGRHPLSLVAAVGLGLGLLAILALVLARFHAAVGLGVLLLAVVRIEPAPADAVFAAVIAVALLTGRFDFRRVPPIVLGLAGAFLALNLFSSIEMIDVRRGTLFFAITLYLLIFAVWLAGYVRSPGRARLLLRLYLIAAIASAAVALLALFVAFPGHETFVFAGDRAQGLFKDPVVFGPFLIPAALMLVEEIAKPRLIGWRAGWKALALVVLALGVVLSYSRAAWLSLALGLVTVFLVLALRRGGGRRALVVLSVILFALATVASALVLTGSTGFLQQRAHLQSYDVERFSAQALGIREGERYPFGIGPGQFDVVSTVSAHSTYVRAFAEEGLPGLLTLLVLIFATLLFAVRNVLRGVDTYGIGSAALLGAWLGLVANSLFVDTLHWRHLWLVAALIWAGSMRAGRDYASSSTGSRVVR